MNELNFISRKISCFFLLHVDNFPEIGWWIFELYVFQNSYKEICWTKHHHSRLESISNLNIEKTFSFIILLFVESASQRNWNMKFLKAYFSSVNIQIISIAEQALFSWNITFILDSSYIYLKRIFLIIFSFADKHWTQ